MRILLSLLMLSACATVSPKADPCVAYLMKATTLPEVQASIKAMGIGDDLARRTAEALMTRRLTPKQVCDSLDK